MFGINGGEAIIILVVAILVIGPERLPKYAEQLAGLVKRARVLMADAKEKVSEELGPEITDVDWAQLDPRRYDPRRIVRDALLDDTSHAQDTAEDVEDTEPHEGPRYAGPCRRRGLGECRHPGCRDRRRCCDGCCCGRERGGACGAAVRRPDGPGWSRPVARAAARPGCRGGRALRHRGDLIAIR